MSVFRMPAGVRRQLEGVMRLFFWRGPNPVKTRGGDLVAWSTVCRPISQEGLGIRHIQRRPPCQESTPSYAAVRGNPLATVPSSLWAFYGLGYMDDAATWGLPLHCGAWGIFHTNATDAALEQEQGRTGA